MQLWPVAHFFSSKLDFPVIKTLEFHSLNVKKSLSYVLLQENLILMKKSGQLVRVAFIRKLLLTELGL
jgi:hypothetical protein